MCVQELCTLLLKIIILIDIYNNEIKVNDVFMSMGVIHKRCEIRWFCRRYYTCRRIRNKQQTDKMKYQNMTMTMRGIQFWKKKTEHVRSDFSFFVSLFRSVAVNTFTHVNRYTCPPTYVQHIQTYNRMWYWWKVGYLKKNEKKIVWLSGRGKVKLLLRKLITNYVIIFA